MNELQPIDQNIIIAAFNKQGGTDELFERIAQEARSFVPDVTTKKGRDAIGSVAMKVSKSKTLIEQQGKALVAEQKAQIKVIDDDRISIVKRLDALREEILSPRVEWEKAETLRVEKHKTFIAEINAYPQHCIDDQYSSSQISGAISRLESVVVDSSLEEFEQEAKLAKYETLDKLKQLLSDREKYEAEQAELEKQRIAEQERLQREHDARIAEQARIEAERKAQADIERAEREKREALEREQRLQAEKAAAEKRAEQQAKQAEIDKQNAIEAERIRIQKQQEAEAKHQAMLEEQRKANIEHKRQIHNDILGALVATGLSDELAKEVIKAIAKNEVPHVSIKY